MGREGRFQFNKINLIAAVTIKGLKVLECTIHETYIYVNRTYKDKKGENFSKLYVI